MPLSTFLNGVPSTQLRGAAWLSFTDTAIIQTRTSTSDSGGGAALSWVNAGTAACRVYPVTMRGRTGLVGAQVNERSTHFLALPVGTSVTTNDRAVVQNRGTFEVTIDLQRTDSLTNVVEVIQVD